MSQLNLNNIINAMLLGGALLAGFILTNRTKEKDDPSARNDGVGTIHTRSLKSKGGAKHLDEPPA